MFHPLFYWALYVSPTSLEGTLLCFIHFCVGHFIMFHPLQGTQEGTLSHFSAGKAQLFVTFIHPTVRKIRILSYLHGFRHFTTFWSTERTLQRASHFICWKGTVGGSTCSLSTGKAS